MKGRNLLVMVAAAGALVLLSLSVFLRMIPKDTTLEFQVRDAVSKNWVYGASFRMQNRLIRSHFQSDRGPTVQRFTHLTPGKATLEVTAPSYQSVSIELNLHRGSNVLRAPIDMIGVEIPDLADFFVVERKIGNDLVCEIRPLGPDGQPILNHPCMELWIVARVSAQVRNGVPLQGESRRGSIRGEKLFYEKLRWTFDSTPETTFRYKAVIPGALLKAAYAPRWVVDYLIVVPDPRKIDTADLDASFLDSPRPKLEELEKLLEPYKQARKLKAFAFSGWNVEGGTL